MIIGLAACVAIFACYAWLLERRPGAWTNGIVLAVGLGLAGLTAVGIVAGTVPVLGLGVVITLVVLAAIGTAVVPFVLIANGIEMRRKEGSGCPSCQATTGRASDHRPRVCSRPWKGPQTAGQQAGSRY